jgi:hypothetical protein
MRCGEVSRAGGYHRRKSGVCRDREVMKPEFGFTVSGANVNMRGFVTLVRIEERSVGSPPEDGWHGGLAVRLSTGWRSAALRPGTR